MEDIKPKNLELSPMSPKSVMKYGLFRMAAMNAIDDSQNAGFSNLATAIKALMPVADFRVEDSTGDDYWDITGAVHNVIHEADKSLDALNRVAPDAEDDEATSLAGLGKVYMELCQAGRAVTDSLEHDRELKRNDDSPVSVG